MAESFSPALSLVAAESYSAFCDSGAPLRLSGAFLELPNPKVACGTYFYATDRGVVYKSTGMAWVVRGSLEKGDVAGDAYGLLSERPPAVKMIGWIYHATDTKKDYEAFPSREGEGHWYTPAAPDPFIGPSVPLNSVARLRASFSNQFGILLNSGDHESQNRIILQTLGASLSSPYVVKFDQHILETFDGDGQFNLVERELFRRVSDGASTGGDTLGSETMNWQEEDVGEFIQVGRNPGRFVTILSVEDPENITVSADIEAGTDLILTMDGKAITETIATKDGFTDGDIVGTENTAGAWARLSKIITSDKVYLAEFAPGATGVGAFSIKPARLTEVR